MTLWKIIILIPVMLMLGCGSGSDDGDMSDDISDETGVVNAVVLNYDIRVDNLPLVGPQAERLKLTIFKHLVRYEGTVEISVGDEKRLVNRISIFNFMDNSQAVISDRDSSYKMIYFKSDPHAGSDSDSLDYIRINKSDELSEINGFSDCYMLKLTPMKKSSRPGVFNDSTPILKGKMWVKGDYSDKEPILNYYKMLGDNQRSQGFNGLEIWRVFDQFGVPNEVILDILNSVDGLIVHGDFTCTMYSLGKKANVAIGLSLTDVTVKRIPGEELRIPDGYVNIYEKDIQSE